MKRLGLAAGILLVVAFGSSLVALGASGSGTTGSVELDVGILPAFSTSLAGNLTLTSGEWSLVTTASVLVYPPIAISSRVKLLWTGEWLSIGAYADLGVIPLGVPGMGAIVTATADPWWVTSDTSFSLSPFGVLERLELGVTFLNAKLDQGGKTTLVGTLAAALWPLPPLSGLLTGTLTLTAGDLVIASTSTLSLFDFALGETLKATYTFAPFSANAWIGFGTTGGVSLGFGVKWTFAQ
jgi:hypothetical protein